MAKGRPFKYDPNKPELIENRINEYFSQCEEREELPLFPELLLYLDITRDTWNNYLSLPDIDIDKYNSDSKYRVSIDNKKYLFAALKKAEQRLEAGMAREAMRTGKAAAIFMLKQKFYGGYQDKQVAEISGDVPINVVIKGSSGKEFKE